jgi:hypothetical protein
MKQAYANRAEDFRRRILRVITTSREELLAEERRWLNMIEDHELGGRYYNLSNRSTCTPRGGLRFRAPRKRRGNHYIQLLVPSAEKKLLLEIYERIRVAKELGALQRANRIRERSATNAILAANAVPIANGVYSFGA